MAETTTIQWTDHTWNPWIGCSKVHTGCLNCYAEADMDKRRGRAKWGIHGTRSRTSEAYWKQPIKWNKDAEAAGVRRRVFCSSLADVFEDWTGRIVDHNGTPLLRCNPCAAYYPDTNDAAGEVCKCGKMKLRMEWATMNDLRHDLFQLIDNTPWLEWQLLTKRPENIRYMWPMWNGVFDRDEPEIEYGFNRHNVWLGTSISDQETANKAIPELLKCRDLSPVLFLSAEPLVGPIDLQRGIPSADGFVTQADGSPKHVADGADSINWVIVGGESGPGARPCNMGWINSIINQCENADVACFVKQLGSGKSEYSGGVRMQPIGGIREQAGSYMYHDSKGGNMTEWPFSMQIREFPIVSKP